MTERQREMNRGIGIVGYIFKEILWRERYLWLWLLRERESFDIREVLIRCY